MFWFVHMLSHKKFFIHFVCGNHHCGNRGLSHHYALLAAVRARATWPRLIPAGNSQSHFECTNSRSRLEAWDWKKTISGIVLKVKIGLSSPSNAHEYCVHPDLFRAFWGVVFHRSQTLPKDQQPLTDALKNILLQDAILSTGCHIFYQMCDEKTLR